VLPPLNELLDVSLMRLRELKDTSPEDADEIFLEDPGPDASSDAEGD
jgi:hypothetical protein